MISQAKMVNVIDFQVSAEYILRIQKLAIGE